MPPSTTKRRLEALSEQLVKPPEDPGMFEDIPKVRRVAKGDDSRPHADKVILITGANSPLGIGRASAHRFATGGAFALYLCDFDSTHLATHKRELQSLYPFLHVETREFDAADDSAVKAVCEDAITRFGRLDVVFANAGITGDNQVFWESDAEDFMDVVRVNTLSVYLAFKHGSRAMLQTSKTTTRPPSTPAPPKHYPSGSLIATSSVAALRSNAGSTSYSASKAAVISLVQTCAFQLAGTGIRCNAVCPGLIETGMTKPVFEMADARGTRGRIGQLNPLRRAGVADEVAAVVAMLGGEGASYVSGQAIPVCGGLSAGHPFVPGKLA